MMVQTLSLRAVATAFSAALPAAYIVRILLARFRLPARLRLVAPSSERVLVLGASSGVGRGIVKKYAARGAKVCAVARRADQLASLASECEPSANIICEVADFSNVADMIRVRERLEKEWGGLDSVHIAAGVSALQPIMSLAGVGEKATDQDATSDGIQNAVDIAGRAIQGNFTGPFVSAIALIPMLLRTSPAPSILLVSTVAAVIPAPTRALYAATKASSLLLYKALAIEHPQIVFVNLLPATIEGDFRSGAVDAHIGGVRENDPNKHGLKIDYVARRSVDAMDQGTKGDILLPWVPYGFGRFLYIIWPTFVEAKARKKYNFHP